MKRKFGLRNVKTGRIARLSFTDYDDMGPPHAYLSETDDDAYWQVGRLADLIETIMDDERALDKGHHSVPATEGFDLGNCQTIAFFVDEEFGEAGGDPVSRTEYVRQFDIDIHFDLREMKSRTRGIAETDTALLRRMFPSFDSESGSQNIALLEYDDTTRSPIHDIALTHDKGAARVVSYSKLPEGWPLRPDQESMRDRSVIVLLDTSLLEDGLDYEQFDVDSKLTRRQ